MGATASMCQGKDFTASAAVLDMTYEDPYSNMSTEDLIRTLRTYKESSFKKIEPLHARAERYVQQFQLSTDRLQRMVDSFVHELDVGLVAFQNHPHEWIPKECSFKMLDSCITKLPTGKERGAYYALDFGGTSFRVVRLNLKGDGAMDIEKRQENLMDALTDSTCCKKMLDANATATQMFDFFAKTVGEFMAVQGDTDVLVGFTFSFPCSQRKIDSATLMNWTKGFETGRNTNDPVEGLDVVELMNVAFKRNDVRALCNSVLNDTVGTLLSCAYSMERSHPTCLVGMILGTGMNCCYVDETAPQYGYQGKIINIECGNFNRDLPRTLVDCELDFKAIDTRGVQQIEKMCSGAYLGEIARLTIVRILANLAPQMAWQAFSLSTENLSKIINDKSRELIVTQKIIQEAWRVQMAHDHLRITHNVATAVMDRSAALAAVLISGCSKKTGRLQPAFGGLTVGMDGSVYKRNPWFQERVREFLDMILGPKISSLIHIEMADDGSGKGAGILAATLHQL